VMCPRASARAIRRTSSSCHSAASRCEPIARWNKQGLLSGTGEIFLPQEQNYSETLPILVGPDGKQMMMLGYFNEINRLLQPLHVKISSLELTSYLSWKLILENGIVLQMGHKDVLTRLNHFVKVYPKIIGDHAVDVDYIDLRYPNGIAVRWKTEGVGSDFTHSRKTKP